MRAKKRFSARNAPSALCSTICAARTEYDGAPAFRGKARRTEPPLRKRRGWKNMRGVFCCTKKKSGFQPLLFFSALFSSENSVQRDQRSDARANKSGNRQTCPHRSASRNQTNASQHDNDPEQRNFQRFVHCVQTPHKIICADSRTEIPFRIYDITNNHICQYLFLNCFFRYRTRPRRMPRARAKFSRFDYASSVS